MNIETSLHKIAGISENIDISDLPHDVFDDIIDRILLYSKTESFTPLQRAYILGSVYNINKERKQKLQKHKKQWICKARNYLEKTDKEPCFVCGKYKSWAQAHHILPLHEQYDMGFEEPDNHVVWLCPTHHEMIHWLILNINKKRDNTAPGCDEFNSLHGEESDKILKLFNMYLNLK